MRAEIDACLQSLIGWGQHGAEEAGRAGGRRRGHQPAAKYAASALCLAALLPSPSPVLPLPRLAINPLAGGWG